MTTTVKDYFKGEIDRKLAEAASIADDVEKTGRKMTPDEETRVEKLLDEVGGLKQSVVDIEKNETMRDRINESRGPVVEVREEAKNASSLGEAFVQSDGFKALKAGGGPHSGRWTSGTIELPWNGKATVTETVSPIVTADTRPGIDPIRTQRLTVADLIPQGTTSGISVVTIQELANTNAAAPTLETGQKQESSITFQTVPEPVRKIATILPVSDEMLEDVDAIRSYLNGRLALFVQQKEEQQLLSGTGTDPELSGIMDRAIGSGTAVSLDADSAVDAIYEAMTVVRTTSFLEPDGLVVNPTDWAGIRLMKDANDQYYGGGPFTGAYGVGAIARDSLWGLPVVVTSAIAAGTALVGAFAQGAFIWRRTGLTVEASNSHDTFFAYNKTAIRAEERLALGVLRPAAFYKITSLGAVITS